MPNENKNPMLFPVCLEMAVLLIKGSYYISSTFVKTTARKIYLKWISRNFKPTDNSIATNKNNIVLKIPEELFPIKNEDDYDKHLIEYLTMFCFMLKYADYIIYKYGVNLLRLLEGDNSFNFKEYKLSEEHLNKFKKFSDEFKKKTVVKTVLKKYNDFINIYNNNKYNKDEYNSENYNFIKELDFENGGFEKNKGGKSYRKTHNRRNLKLKTYKKHNTKRKTHKNKKHQKKTHKKV
jgi:hypothetical protein